MSKGPAPIQFSLSRCFLWLTIVCVLVANGPLTPGARERRAEMNFLVAALLGGMIAASIAMIAVPILRELRRRSLFSNHPPHAWEWLVLLAFFVNWLTPFVYRLLF